MNQYMAQLKSYLADHVPSFGYRDVDSILEMFYCFYAEHNPMHNDKIHALFYTLNSELSHLNLQENDLVFDAISDLCAEYQRLAFVEGIRAGARLYMELDEQSPI